MQILQKDITINSKKFDNQIHKSWKADLLEKDDSLLIFIGVFEFEIKHTFLGVIRPGTISYEFYWLDRWFNVFKFYEPDGKFLNFYCNINTPPIFENGILEYTDLDIDIIVGKDFSPIILDQDEFEENSLKYKYSDEILINTKVALNELLSEIKGKNFPFDSNQNLTNNLKSFLFKKS